MASGRVPTTQNIFAVDNVVSLKEGTGPPTG